MLSLEGDYLSWQNLKSLKASATTNFVTDSQTFSTFKTEKYTKVYYTDYWYIERVRVSGILTKLRGLFRVVINPSAKRNQCSSKRPNLQYNFPAPTPQLFRLDTSLILNVPANWCAREFFNNASVTILLNRKHNIMLQNII